MMRSTAILLAAALAAGPGASGADAQRDRPRGAYIAEFAACAARVMPDRARELMATPIASREEHRAGARIAARRGGCLSLRLRSLTLRVGEVRGAVAEVLLEGDSAALARLRRMPPTAPVRPQAAEGRAFVAAYARCLADADPARATSLLDAAPESAGERAAILGFGDLLNACMPLDLRYAINTYDVRTHVAIRLYEIAFPAPGPSGTASRAS